MHGQEIDCLKGAVVSVERDFLRDGKGWRGNQGISGGSGTIEWDEDGIEDAME